MNKPPKRICITLGELLAAAHLHDESPVEDLTSALEHIYDKLHNKATNGHRNATTIITKLNAAGISTVGAFRNTSIAELQSRHGILSKVHGPIVTTLWFALQDAIILPGEPAAITYHFQPTDNMYDALAPIAAALKWRNSFNRLNSAMDCKNHTVKDFCELTREQILNMEGCGTATADHVAALQKCIVLM